jgi:hypothetical protein
MLLPCYSLCHTKTLHDAGRVVEGKETLGINVWGLAT